MQAKISFKEIFVSILEKIIVSVKYSYFMFKTHPINNFNLFLIIVSSVKMGPVGTRLGLFAI